MAVGINDVTRYMDVFCCAGSVCEDYTVSMTHDRRNDVIVSVICEVCLYSAEY